MKTSLFTSVVVLVVFGMIYTANGEEAKKKIIPTGIETNDVNIVSSVSIAVIDFDSKAPGNPELGSQISDILTARLSIYDHFKLVERQKIDDVIREHQINLSGLADSSQVVNVGKIIGARIMVFGRAFVVDEDLYIVAKIVGTETSIVKGVMSKGRLEGNLSEIVDSLVEKLTTGLDEWVPQLLPKSEKFVDRIAAVKSKLKGEKLPRIAVLVTETHVNRQVIDPASRIEIEKVLIEIGFYVVEAEDGTEALKNADIIVTGEGFSEFGGHFGGLFSCTARLEVKVTDVQDKNIILSERTTKRAIDLSELIAGKTALQAAGHELAIKVAEKVSQKIEAKK